MIRTDCRGNEQLSRVMERYQYHSSKMGSANPVIADAARIMRDVDIWEMWALTQK